MANRLIASAFLCLGLLATAGSAQTITFVDEQGDPATTLLDNGAVRVRVTDPAANTSPGRDAVTADVTSDLGGDSESLSLLETGPGTGVFEGLVDLVYFYWTPGLVTASSAGPPPTHDTLHATYPVNGATAAAGLVKVSFSFIDAWGRESTSFVAGHTVGLRARSDWFSTEFGRDYVQLQISSLTSGDSESWNLMETGTNTGVFEGFFPTTRSLSPSGDGQLGVSVGDTVTVAVPTYWDQTAPSAQIQATGSVLVLLDADGKPADTFTEISRVHIRVTAPAASGPVSVQVAAAQSGDVETVLLSAVGQGSYEGEIDVEPIPHNTPDHGDGVLQHSKVWGPPLQMDTVTVSYAGSGGTSSDSASFIRGRIEFLDVLGEPTSTYASGSEVSIRLEFPADNNSPFSVDQTWIALVDQSGDDMEYLSLVESGPDTGIFVGSMPLRSVPAQNYDHVLNAQPGEWIRASFEGEVLQVTADVTELSLVFIDEQGEPTHEVLEGGEARVRMLNVSANTDAWNVETVSIEVRALFAQDVETLVLTETGPDTGLFEGAISLQHGASSTPDGLLQAAGSGHPGYRPEELTARFGAFEATARTLGARIEFVDASGARTPGYNAGETVRIRITDHVRAAAGSSLSVTLRDQPPMMAAGDVEELTLVKTGAGSSVFEGSIPSAIAGYVPNDGQLGAHAGDRIEVQHVTAYSPIPVMAQVSVIGALNRAPEPYPDYAMTPEDQSVTISVLANDTDPDGDTLLVVAVTQPLEGTVAINPGETAVTYTPAPNADGRLTFQVTISDPEGLEATSEVTVDVTPVNDPPVAVDDVATTPEDTEILIDILANDSDIDSKGYYPSSVTDPPHGTVQHGPSGARYTPDPGFSGVDTFSYTLIDSEGATDTATVTVTVTPVAPPRVTANLQVLYELEEGSGTAVADTSGVGTPLNLTIGNASAVNWIPGGLSVNAPTLIQSATAATKVISAVKSTHSITLEAWVEPANTTQTGPAPVVTVSQTAAIRNFTLGQNGNRWETRVRTSNTNPTGYGHNSPVGTATQNLTHVVYTRDASTTVKIYINGVQVLNGYVTGTFATWPTTQKLGLAAELNGANPWLGKLYLVAVYNRALSAAEVQQNWEAGE